MTDKELFKEVFDRIAGRHNILTMSGTVIYCKDEPKFSIDGYNLGYNLLRLTKLLEDIGEFM